jgi:phage terminase large subunit-like protein
MRIDSNTGKLAIIIGGIGSGGTIAGGEYVSNASSLDQLRRAAQSAGNKKTWK